ncbi:hypothetical protein [Nostoc sp.]
MKIVFAKAIAPWMRFFRVNPYLHLELCFYDFFGSVSPLIIA